MHFEGYAKCVCSSSTDGDDAEINECEGDMYKTDEFTADDQKCICAFDRNTKDAWPCYPEVSRKMSRMSFCLFILGNMDEYFL